MLGHLPLSLYGSVVFVRFPRQPRDAQSVDPNAQWLFQIVKKHIATLDRKMLRIQHASSVDMQCCNVLNRRLDDENVLMLIYGSASALWTLVPCVE